MSIKSVLFKKTTNFCIFILFAFLTAMPVLAEENIISSVIISKAKNNENAYELNIDSSKTVDYKTETEEEGTVYFDLKNSVLADNVNTLYDDVTDIDNVSVRQLDKNKVRIYVTGKNAVNTELVFINSLFDTAHQPKKITINRPIDEYKSTNNLSDEDLENQEEIQDWNDNSFNFYHLMSETLSGAKESVIGIALIIVSILVFVFIAIRAITSKISQDSEPLIGLNNTNKYSDEIIPRLDAVNTISKMSPKEIDFNEIANRNEVMKNAQEQLTKAHNKYQEYLKNKYKNNNPIKMHSAESDSLKKSMALNQYKRSDKNPYLDQKVISMNEVNSFNINQGLIPSRPKVASEKRFNTSPYIQKPTPKINYRVNSNSEDNSTSLKFLESVSKIYEQSGREDLAKDLKKSISKSHQKI